MVRYNHKRLRRQLKVLSVNVQNSDTKNDDVLALGARVEYDVIHVQEPYAVWANDSLIFKDHPWYMAFAHPATSEHDTPRVMTYVREGLKAKPLAISESRYTLWVVIEGVTFVNVYCQPEHHESLEPLLQWPPDARTVVTGEFYAEAGMCRWPSDGKSLSEWAEEHALQLIDPPKVPTHDQGGIFDLAFSNMEDVAYTQSGAKDLLKLGFDRRTLGLCITLRVVKPRSERKHILGHDPVSVEMFERMVKCFIKCVDTNVRNGDDVDRLATGISEVLRGGLHVAGRLNTPKGNRKVWWNEECNLVHKEVLKARRSCSEDLPEIIKEFKGAVRRAKRAYWGEKIDAADTKRAVHAMSAWAERTTPSTESPPLVSGGKYFLTAEEKAEELRRVKLQRVGAGDDHPLGGIPTAPRRSIAFSHEVTLREAWLATCASAEHTAPGTDDINVRLLRLAWPWIGEHVRILVSKSLELGHYPRVFREAEVVMLPKPGKTDFSSPKSYRPISLTSCLGKALGRILSWRLSYAAIQEGVLHPDQIGSLPKRAATDIAAALTHDVEVALENGDVATMVTMDVEGAFDCVLPNRLASRLREQGWPDHVTKLAASFMTERRCRVRFEDYVGGFHDLECGLPQGAPESPILFALYVQPIYQFLDIGNRYGYADDTAQLVVGSSLEYTAQRAALGVEELLAWGRDNAIAFGPEKTEIMHFSRRPCDDDVNPTIIHGDREISPGTDMRWLGVFFDRKLTFSSHVDRWIARASEVACNVLSMSGTSSGPPPWFARQVAKASIEPILYYGAEVWYPGVSHSDIQDENEVMPTEVAQVVERMEMAVMTAARAILPDWETLPISDLHRESGMLPAQLMLEHIRRRHAARLQSLDPDHPLVSRLEGDMPTRLQQAWSLFPKAERPVLRSKGEPPRAPPETGSKEEEAKAFKAYLLTLPSTDLLAFTDGSLLDNGVAGWGFSIRRLGTDSPLRLSNGRLDRVEVFDAEAHAALHGLQACLELRTDPGQCIRVFLDNQSVVDCLLGRPADSSQKEFLTFQELAAGANVHVRWVPGHSGIRGNEEADAMAKQGAARAEPSTNPPSLAWVMRRAREATLETYEEWAAYNLASL